MKNFKYKTISMFFDADSIACTFVDDVSELFPMLKQEFINMSWNIGKKDNSLNYSVLAIADAQDIIINYIER